MNMSRVAVFSLPIFFPFFAFASDLININTADAALLDTLPGIGPAYAARIVEYRGEHGPFARIEDIQNVSGIGPGIFAQISSLITVGSSVVTAAPAATSSPQSETSGDAYVPPPAALTLKIDGGPRAIVGAPLSFSARVTNKGGAANIGAEVTWTFGDGSSLKGREVEKTYRYAGTYVVMTEASEGGARDKDEIVITVTPAIVHIATLAGEGVVIANGSKERLDLSGWRIASSAGSFRIPKGTVILPETSVVFSSSVMSMLPEEGVMLQYPDGTVAARSIAPASTVEQLSGESGGYESIQAARLDEAPARQVEPITSVVSEAHDEAIAPAVPTYSVGTAGAAYAPALVSADDTAMAPSFMRSPWFLGFLGVVALAGGAFILL